MKKALLLIDLQKGFLEKSWGARGNPELERKVAAALKRWRAEARPVIHVQHISKSTTSVFRPESPGKEFIEAAAPLASEPVFRKRAHSAFIGTELEAYLRAEGISSLAIGGLAVDHCVSTTTRHASDLGFEVELVEDLSAAFERKGASGETIEPADVLRVTLASLRGEFADIVRAEDLK